MEISDVKFGRLIVLDPRDGLHPMVRYLDMEIGLPAGKVWYASPTLDQDGTPQCVAYAWEGWLHASPTCTRTGPTPEEIYREAQKIDGMGPVHDGTTVRAAAQIMAGQGRIAEYVWTRDLEVLKRWVLTRGSAVVGTWWYYDMFAPTKAGYVTIGGRILGGHAYLVIGYSGARKAYRCLNSWGRNWGQGGRFWITEADLDRLISESGEACAAVERQA
jgi:hypothetical protein